MTIANRHSATLDRSTVSDQTVEALLERAHRRIDRAMRLARRPEARVGVASTPVGRLLVAESDRGLAAVHFPAPEGWDSRISALSRKFDLLEDHSTAKRVASEIDRYLRGDFSALKRTLDLSLVGGDFRRRTMSLLRRVPTGAVVTYRALAARAGQPDAQRAVGNAMATNPIPIFIPCHRVIRSDGSVGNYGGGVSLKLRLLRTEGFAADRGPRLGGSMVLANRGTKTYCRPGCAAARRADQSRIIIFADAERARRSGMRACMICRPG